jgi:diadenosine tetraphosphate (Ap4A) HIT family hydrolase
VRRVVPVMDCPICARRVAYMANDYARAIFDAYPSSPNHVLVVPRTCTASMFDLPDRERAAVWSLVADVRAALGAECGADGFTVGLNDGQAAGQTVAHAHVHVIPRHFGDVPDPRGGVRWVLPKTAPYWSTP